MCCFEVSIMFWWWIFISFQVCQSFMKFLRNFALHDFLISGAVIFLLTYQGEEVRVAVFQGGSVCLKVDVSHCSHILFTFPHFTSFWDVLEGLKTRKSKKMCLSSYSLMAVGETQQAEARPGPDWSSSVAALLSLVQTGHVTGASKDGRLGKLARDLERVIFGNYHEAMLRLSLSKSCWQEKCSFIVHGSAIFLNS